jgi:hypothetical protein
MLQGLKEHHSGKDKGEGLKSKDMLQETFRMQNKLRGKPSTSKPRMAMINQAMSYVQSPKTKVSTHTKRVPLNHTFKDDQVILLFKMLKHEYKSREMG